MHMDNLEQIKKKMENAETADKNRAWALAQKDLAITQETHERLVDDLRIDRKTQKDEIERIKKSEERLSTHLPYWHYRQGVQGGRAGPRAHAATTGGADQEAGAP